MIQHIKNIGAYVRSQYPDVSVIDGMVNDIQPKDMNYILFINVLEKEIQLTTKEFEKNIVFDALFFQAGRAAEGGGIRLDFYEDAKAKKEEERFKKGRDKLKKACEFCEVSNRYEEIQEQVETYLKEKDQKTFAVIQVNGKMPRELFENKFTKKMYSMKYKEVQGKHVCHLCGEKGQGYNTVTYTFYTNDKGIYSNLDHKEKSGILIGENCLKDIIIGKKYVEKNLTTYLINRRVMFLPHHYDEEVADIYEKSYIKEKKGKEEKIKTIRLNEEDLVDEVGKTNAVTDMIFYEENPTNKAITIDQVIQSVLPSRFSYIGNLFKKYEIKLNTILMYSTALKVSLESVESTDKEKMRMIESIFTGRKIDRNLFFKRVMDVYKHNFLRDEHKKYACMRNISKTYNFLCECNCLEKGWDVMADYKDYGELFEQNKEYFDTNEKKAWFILGKAYNTMVYLMKSKNKSEENTTENERTSLEKNFFFSRKFDYKDFIYFSNLLTDKAVKYKVESIYFKKMICEAKEYMAKQENKLSFDEAKYLFFWGVDAYFKKEKEENEEE